MKSRPIIFSAPMVRAILAGKKSQTRRIVRPTIKGCTVGVYSDSARGPYECVNVGDDGDPVDSDPILCPYGVPGDELYVREAFASFNGSAVPSRIADATYVLMRDGAQVYRSGRIDPPVPVYAPGAFDHVVWRPSIHMPRWASRITLVVRSVRVEMLSAIPWDDVAREGIDLSSIACRHFGSATEHGGCTDCMNTGLSEDPRPHFLDAFRSMHNLAADADPWLWVIGFERKDKL